MAFALGSFLFVHLIEYPNRIRRDGAFLLLLQSDEKTLMNVCPYIGES